MIQSEQAVHILRHALIILLMPLMFAFYPPI